VGKAKQPQVLSMILLDAVNTKYRNQSVVRRAVVSILEQIEPAERVAIYALGSRFRVIHNFSSDRASLLASSGPYHGEVPGGDDLLDDIDLDQDSHTHHRRRNSRRATMPAGSSTRPKRSKPSPTM